MNASLFFEVSINSHLSRMIPELSLYLFEKFSPLRYVFLSLTKKKKVLCFVGLLNKAIVRIFLTVMEGWKLQHKIERAIICGR